MSSWLARFFVLLTQLPTSQTLCDQVPGEIPHHEARGGTVDEVSGSIGGVPRGERNRARLADQVTPSTSSALMPTNVALIGLCRKTIMSPSESISARRKFSSTKNPIQWCRQIANLHESDA